MELARKLSLFQDKIRRSELVGRTFKLFVITFLSNVLGFLVPVYIAFVYGVSKHTDQFFLSYGVITFINIIFSTAISTVTVPFIKEKMEDKVWLREFISAFFYYSSKFLGIACLSVFLLLLIADHFISNEFLLYFTLSVPILFFSILNSFCYGVLNSFHQYNTAALSPFSRAVIIFLTIFLFSGRLGVVAVILGYNLGEMVKFLQLIFIIKRRNNIDVSLKVKNYGLIKKFVREGSYQAISSSISCAAPLIDKIVAAFLAVGSLSVLDYGDKVALILGVLLNAFLVVVLGKWATEVAARSFRLNKMVHILVSIFGLSAFVFLLVAFGRSMLVNILYPTLPHDKKDIIAWIIVLNTAGFVFNSVNQVINIGNIAFKATAILVKTSMIKAVINLVLDVVFGLKWGVIGIVISTVFVHLSGLIINFLIFKYKVYHSYQNELEPEPI